MSGKIKLWSYVVLVVLVVWLGLRFRSQYSAVSAVPSVSNLDSQLANSDVDTGPRVNQPGPSTNVASSGASNTAALATNAASTNEALTTNETVGANATAATNTTTASGDGSNSVEQASNAPPTASAVRPPTNASAKSPRVPTTAAAVPAPPSRAVGYLAAFVVALIGLGCLIAYDATQFIGQRSVEFLFNDRGEGMREPEYEKAEQVWANGNYLEAIELMRDYLRKNRREQYVALRIAEIYEKDLKNYLAAALEYEEILKKKLPHERWGWAAIHLCNLYTKMSQQAKAIALLERVANEYPKTAAAKKARTRLGWAAVEEEQVEAEPEPPQETPELEGDRKTFEVTNPEGEITFEEESPEPPPPPPPPEAKPNLPPGFRPKK